ncbi:hypothetical protein GDO81_010389 [Engystomops pustulosus]|uniref:Uncharacterized protein n=1 Tax=Engystomops pustulosus TaxID=76066 RepID=A0AAV7BZL6_ENGPU|nr:hypothetical protein GDO81_010389 [Engystomops pustulosus]
MPIGRHPLLFDVVRRQNRSRTSLSIHSVSILCCRNVRSLLYQREHVNALHPLQRQKCSFCCALCLMYLIGRTQMAVISMTRVSIH